MPNLQKVQVNRKAASRSSYPGYFPKKNSSTNKSSKARSYMEATSSSKAKIFRSVSMGDGINVSQAEEQKRLSNMSRPASSIDLFTLEQKRWDLAEDHSCKPLLPPTSNEQMPSGQRERARSMINSSNPLSDTILMPPPTSCGVITRLKKKAKSVSNLSKVSRKEDLNGMVVKPKDGGDALKNRVETDLQNDSTSYFVKNKTQDAYDFSRRASIADIPTYAPPSIPPDNSCAEGQIFASVPSDNLSVSPTSFSSHLEELGAKDLLSRCQQVIKELHGTFQKTLETYKEIENSSGSLEEKTHLSSLFQEAFGHIQSEMDLVGIEQRMASKEPQTSEENIKNPTLNLLVHYSEMMLRLMREKISIE